MTNDPWATTPTERPSWLTDEIEDALIRHRFPIDQSGMLMLHADTKKRLDEYKEMEMEFRKVCVGFLVPDKTEGTHNTELGNGYVAKSVVKYNYKLDSDNNKIWDALAKIETVGNEGKFIAERLVSWTPNFLKQEYTALMDKASEGSQDAKAILKIINDSMLTITEAAPTLSIVEPKKKK